MTKRTKRYPKSQESKRLYYGEEMATDLIDFLNQYSASPEGRRVASLIDALQSLNSLLASAGKWYRDDKDKKIGGLRFKDEGLKVMRLEVSIDAALSKYIFRRYLYGLTKGSRPPSFFKWKFGFKSMTQRRSDREVSAADLACQMAEAGVIDALRRCDNCKQWFFKKSRIQRHCSERCRMRLYQTSKEWKEYKKQKAKELYQLHKTKNIKTIR